MVLKYLATPYTISNYVLQPNLPLTVPLPTYDYPHALYYGFAGALLVWQSSDPSQPEVPSLTFEATFTPVKGQSAILRFDLVDLITLGQYGSIPDNVFPVAMQGAGFYVAKWAPVSPYQFKKLIINVINKNSIPVIIRDGLLLYYVYSTEEEINELADLIIEEEVSRRNGNRL